MLLPHQLDPKKLSLLLQNYQFQQQSQLDTLINNDIAELYQVESDNYFGSVDAVFDLVQKLFPQWGIPVVRKISPGHYEATLIEVHKGTGLTPALAAMSATLNATDFQYKLSQKDAADKIAEDLVRQTLGNRQVNFELIRNIANTFRKIGLGLNVSA